MMKQDYLELLVENIHSTTIATIGADGHPQTRVIDMMLYDEQGVYFLTAKANAPMSAGKSDRSILAKDGDSGTGNSTKARTYAIAESSAVMVMVRILMAAALFGCCMVTVWFIMLLS